MKLFNRLPIGRKLQLVNLSSAIVALLVSSVLLIEKNNADLEEQLESRIDKASRIVAANIQAAVIFEDWEMAEEVTRPLLQDTAV